jgi:hypothetical protein
VLWYPPVQISMEILSIQGAGGILTSYVTSKQIHLWEKDIEQKLPSRESLKTSRVDLDAVITFLGLEKCFYTPHYPSRWNQRRVDGRNNEFRL